MSYFSMRFEQINGYINYMKLRLSNSYAPKSKTL